MPPILWQAVYNSALAFTSWFSNSARGNTRGPVRVSWACAQLLIVESLWLIPRVWKKVVFAISASVLTEFMEEHVFEDPYSTVLEVPPIICFKSKFDHSPAVRP